MTKRKRVGILVCAVTLAVVVSSMLLFAHRDRSSSTAAFCEAYDQAAPRINASVQTAQDKFASADVQLQAYKLEDSQALNREAEAALNEVKSEYEALVQKAPPAIRSDFAYYADFSAARERPSQQAKFDKAKTHVDSFVKARCGFNPVL